MDSYEVQNANITTAESIEVDEGIFIEKTENGDIVGIQILDGSKSEYIVGAMKDFVDIPKKDKND